MKTEEYTDILTLVAGFIVCKRRDLARVIRRNKIKINRIYNSKICMHQHCTYKINKLMYTLHFLVHDVIMHDHEGCEFN